jgi:hypothetical protein
MATLINLLKNLPSPLMLIVAGYIGLRALEMRVKNQRTFGEVPYTSECAPGKISCSVGFAVG